VAEGVPVIVVEGVGVPVIVVEGVGVPVIEEVGDADSVVVGVSV
jgi:hypothetical protein